MKGIIFNIFEAYILYSHGESTYDAIVQESHLILNEPIVGPGTYPDEDFLEMLKVGTDVLGIQKKQLLRQLGRFALGELVSRYPHFVEGYEHPKEFLKSVDGIIHVEVRKLHQNAYLPVFTYEEIGPNILMMTYYSKRKLYDLAEGLIEGVADHFDHPIKQSNQLRTVDGKEVCEFRLEFQDG